ncbi:MAG: DMT family transporter [Cyanobacteriota bacterium]
MTPSHPWLLLGLAIAAEVLGTSCLRLSAGMTRPGPTLLVLASYAVAMVLMARVVLVLPLGLTYAIWSGLGIVATVKVGVLAYGQIPTTGQLMGMALIVAGVVIVNLKGPA